MVKAIDSKAKAVLIANLALDKKAEDLLLLDMRRTSNFCDYFIICSGNSERQMKAIADVVKEGLEKKDINLRAIEGTEESGWLLLDYFDVVLHIFYSPIREFYKLERLWQQANRLKLQLGMQKYVRKAGRRKSK